MRILTRTDVINFLIRRNGYSRYLEIGVRRPESNFAKVKAKHKEGVDPAPLGPIEHRMTSDEFFAGRPADAPPFDLVMVDGLHLEEQVLRDVDNALEHLSPAGSVVMHDCSPLTQAAQEEHYDGVSTWNGTVWKAWAKLRMTRPDLCMAVVDTDHGVGVITRGAQSTFPATPDAQLTFAFLDAHRDELLHLVAPQELARIADELYETGATPLLRRRRRA